MNTIEGLRTDGNIVENGRTFKPQTSGVNGMAFDRWSDFWPVSAGDYFFRHSPARPVGILAPQ